MARSLTSGLTPREKKLLSKVDPSRIPVHISFIADGNGRWARERGLPRWMGHRAGIDALRDILRVAVSIEGIRYLSLFAFSTENWNRPKEELEHLFNYITEYVDSESSSFVEAGIKVTVIGDLSPFPERMKNSIERVIEETSRGSRLTAIFALNYGGRWDILNALKKLCSEVSSGSLELDNVDYSLFSRYLSTSGIPDPDFLIRTSGEMRISNFMLWQLAYTELYFPKKYWPDFKGIDLIAALMEYQRRERRFGRIK